MDLGDDDPRSTTHRALSFSVSDCAALALDSAMQAFEACDEHVSSGTGLYLCVLGRRPRW